MKGRRKLSRSLDYVIVGTGPSGIAAAASLIALGIRPTLIDAGELINGRVTTARNRSTNLATDEASQPNNPGQKSWFGSYEAYAQNYSENSRFEEPIQVRPSNSIGGFSRVWGATFEFWEMDNRWPANAQIKPGDFESISRLVPNAQTSMQKDESEGKLLSPASSSREIFSTLSSKLSSGEVTLSPSRLAIQTRGEYACIRCASCLDGCPQDSIWFAGEQLQIWLNANKVELIGGCRVSRILTENQHLVIECDSKDGQAKSFSANKVFLAAGAIATAEIAIKSGLRQEVVVKDTSTVFTAAIGLTKQPTPMDSQSLSQFWIRWRGQSPLVAQVYAPNISNIKRVTSRFAFFKHFEWLLGNLVLRLHPIILYLGADQSPSISVRSIDGVIQVREVQNEFYFNARKEAINRIRRVFSKAKLFVPPVGTDFSAAGTGYHFGSSFPMGQESDSLGQIAGWKGVHIVDSSVLPYLEVGSITPTVMANSYRIARESLRPELP